MASPAVVLLSGGLDSATALAIARAEGYRCHALSFDYGQRHACELESARRVATALGVEAHLTLRVDLRAIGEMFAQVDSVQWQALPLGANDELGPHVSLEGTYEGNPVWLRILSKAPKRFKPGRRAVVYEAAWEEMW